ncbi:hypothetical protein [Nannocystis sp. SCPEA4]|uniref:hypothetical protein n=1 Tax=Nannocystis sp. SCPEA4 TaxID=2996787 RepID=UPI00226D7857|nr:hypothetical protein [Nannocystis sp. SCPEA4]MCY1059584.1 hypothetical protein [Nannocystis sp. SCPEA4]
MWRVVQADRVVHDEYFPLLLVFPALFVAVVIAAWFAAPDAQNVGWLLALFFALFVVGTVLRRRTELVHASGEVRVRWVIAPTPSSPGLTLRTLLASPRAALSQVVVDLSTGTQENRVHPVVLLYADPARRHETDVERIPVASFRDRAAAVAAANRLAEDLGLPARDCHSPLPWGGS